MRTLKYSELNLNDHTLEALNKANIDEASSLQQTLISKTVEKQSIVVNADPGDDKNTAFAIAAVEHVQQREEPEGTAVLIITDKAEVAEEICSSIEALGLPNDETVACISNNGSAEKQAEQMEQSPSVIVANPERLQDLLQEHRFIFRHISLLVLDELKHILSNGQAENLKKIKRRVLSDYTTLVCCTSFDEDVKKMVSSFTDEPTTIGFDDSSNNGQQHAPQPVADHLTQGYINVPPRMKISTLTAHIEQTPSGSCVIFTASKRGTDRLYRVLKKRGLKATSLHRKLSDEKREQRFSNFANSDVQFLLVSDISGNDLDLNNVTQVINYDVPNTSDEYRFRAALAAKNKSGRIVSLVSKQDRSDINVLQNELGQTPEEIPLPEEAKKKLKQREKKNSQKKSPSRSKRKKRPSRPGQKSSDQKSDEMQLPQPRYDKLSGGRSGNHKEETNGFVKFFKKLFSS